MTFAARMILIVTLVVATAGRVSAQRTTTTATAETPVRTGEVTSHHIREQFSNLLRQSPPELATILVLDPTLLSNEAFLAGYADLARFVAEHPEVRRNPRFYLSGFRVPGDRSGRFELILEGVMIFGTFLLSAFALAWFIRTIIEQRRWNRLSQTQSEVHNKILDRFGSSEELLEYIRSPAGTKFLQSAPIPLRAEQAMQNPPLTRIMWSIQLGVVVVAGALGMLLVSSRFEGEAAQELSALGVIALSLGAGFIASAIVSIAVSRRLGLWQGPVSPNAVDDSGLVR